MNKSLELLAPAKNLEQGKAAINHGADAVYIGAPLFGARVAAGNSIEDIENLVSYAHLYGAKVFATVNTLLFDNELQEARNLLWALYNTGVDAAIVQDMGLLELDLPPIELHASTQTHNIDPRRIKFLEQVGFKRIILARETSLQQMASLRQEITADLEAFIHGALCVCYSGQCYMSLHLNGRSGNRGNCSQPCRSTYDLMNSEGKMLRHDEHLLSLKDFNASRHIESMIDAGITSFKIEGRLKDVSYVKNVTAYYRKLIDSIIERRNSNSNNSQPLNKASSGKTFVTFEPDPERTFNRGFTDYFLVGRHPMSSRTTQKSLGKKVGEVISAEGNRLKIKSDQTLSAGDGICYFNNQGKLEGFLVNHFTDRQITANKVLEITPGTALWRNNDFKFEKILQSDSSERKIGINLTLSDTPTGLRLTVKDEEGCMATADIICEKNVARDPLKAKETIETQLSKLGGTPFSLEKTVIETEQSYFIPASVLNALRRTAVERLTEVRILHHKAKDCKFTPNEVPYYETYLDERANVVNKKAEAFYRRHGVTEIVYGLDAPVDRQRQRTPAIPLMTTKYCIRYELGQCLKHKCNTKTEKDFESELWLHNNGRSFLLRFDCQRCEMLVLAEE